MHVAVLGSGAAGLSAAWLLSKRCKVTLLEREERLGGHAHTATIECDVKEGQALKVDTGFIVYNEPSYPNLTRWFAEMGVSTQKSEMSFAVSRDNGNFEYAGGPALGMLAQPTLPLRPRFWRMLSDLLRFYRQATNSITDDSQQSLGDFLQQHKYNDEFINDHLLPFGAAIWSTSRQKMLEYPATAFIRFCSNHGLLQISNRPQWRTVTGGSEQYVAAVEDAIGTESVVTGFDAQCISRQPDSVTITDKNGREVTADHVVIASHADDALALLSDPSEQESSLLSAFSYETNHAYLHTDTRYLPKRRRAWCSWNYVERAGDNPDQVSVSYWMNNLQNLKTDRNYVVTLNPTQAPAQEVTFRSVRYQHPVFTAQTWTAQQQLWSLQGKRRTWFCGSYFGSGFHEDAIQSGLAVAEHLSGIERPWQLDDPSPRIVVPSARMAQMSNSLEDAA